MKKTLLIFALILSSAFATTSVEATHQQEKVLICNSKNAYAFHSHYCQGLNRCKADVIELSVAEAKKRGRKPCGYCY